MGTTGPISRYFTPSPVSLCYYQYEPELLKLRRWEWVNIKGVLNIEVVSLKKVMINP